MWQVRYRVGECNSVLGVLISIPDIEGCTQKPVVLRAHASMPRCLAGQ
jgi:hypothetical protein